MYKITKHFIVSGKVQGVGFRAFVQGIARQYGLSGWVRNLSSGQVEVLVCGLKESLHAFQRDLKRGPLRARVTGLEEFDIEGMIIEDGFVIERDGAGPWSKK